MIFLSRFCTACQSDVIKVLKFRFGFLESDFTQYFSPIFFLGFECQNLTLDLDFATQFSGQIPFGLLIRRCVIFLAIISSFFEYLSEFCAGLFAVGALYTTSSVWLVATF